jgi:hypothetical protein
MQALSFLRSSQSILFYQASAHALVCDGLNNKQSRTSQREQTGPSILMVLLASVVLAAIFLGVVWFVFFRTDMSGVGYPNYSWGQTGH